MFPMKIVIRFSFHFLFNTVPLTVETLNTLQIGFLKLGTLKVIYIPRHKLLHKYLHSCGGVQAIEENQFNQSIPKNDGNRWCRIRRDTPPGAVSEQALYVVCASAAVVAVGGSRWHGGGGIRRRSAAPMCRRRRQAATTVRSVCSLDVRPSLMHSTELRRRRSAAAAAEQGIETACLQALLRPSRSKAQRRRGGSRSSSQLNLNSYFPLTNSPVPCFSPLL